jgi:hypothetical protein
MNNRIGALVSASVLLGVFALPAAFGQMQSISPLVEGHRLVQNQGQWPEGVRFASEAGRFRVRAEESGIGLDLFGRGGEGSEIEGNYVRLAFVGGSGSRPIGLKRSNTLRHYYQGQSSADWFTDVPEFAAVLWDDVWPGIDVKLGRRDGKWAYDLEVEEGADLSQIRIELQGAEAVKIDWESGELLASIGQGTLSQSRPVLWYEILGERVNTSGGFRLQGEGTFGFELHGARQAGRLVIDPGFDFVTYLGGVNQDSITQVEVDSQERIIFGGSSRSPEFPSVPGPFPYVANSDAVIGRLRLKPAPALEFVAFVAGNADDELYALALGPGDRIFVGGETNSKNFPLTPGAIDPIYNEPFSETEGWIAAIRPEGNGLVYSTYLGGQPGSDYLNAVAVDSAGVATFVGRSVSMGFPTTPGAYQASKSTVTWDGVVSRISADGMSFVYSTFLGGSAASEELSGVAIDAAGNTYVCGSSTCCDYPKTPGVLSQGVSGGLLSVLDPTGSTLLASTWIGGAPTPDTEFNDICLGPDGNLFVCGFTRASNFPVTPGAFDVVGPTGVDREVVVFDITPDLSQIVNSTFLGKTGIDPSMISRAERIRVDASGVVTMVGTSDGTTDNNVQTTPGSAMPSPTGGGSRQPFIVRFTPDLDRLLYGSHMNAGLSSLPSGLGAAVFSDGGAVCSGMTQLTTSLPVTPNAIQPTAGGGLDGFLAVFDMLPFGATRYGQWTSPCSPSIWIGVTEQPKPGSSTFGVLASGAPANALGFLVLSLAALPAAQPILGLNVWIDPVTLALFLPTTSDAHGFTETPFPLPITSQGKTLYCQYLWLNPPGCGDPGTFSSSSALGITVQ